MLTHVSCGYNKWNKKDVLKVLSVLTSKTLSDPFTKSLSQADAERCFRCMNFHMGNVGRGRHRKLGKT